MSVAVITGASAGIGRATALEFAARGYRVALLARNEAALGELTRLIGPNARAYTVDVTDGARVAEVADRVRTEMNGLDVWVNNAGVGAVGSITEVPLDHHHRVLAVNLGGALNGSRAALNVFNSQGHGVLINVASISSYIAQPATLAYVTSKFALRGLTYAIRQDAALAGAKRVHACLVHPQVVDTKVFDHMANFSGSSVDLPLPKVSAERVARAIVRTAEHPRREVYVGWFGWLGVLGHRFFPALAERLMTWLARWYFEGRPQDRPPNGGNLFETTR